MNRPEEGKVKPTDEILLMASRCFVNHLCSCLDASLFSFRSLHFNDHDSPKRMKNKQTRLERIATNLGIVHHDDHDPDSREKELGFLV